MPRLSIVLVVHREQGFVRSCLNSVLAQSPSDVEIVVVDDAAADHSAEIAHEVAAGDDRVRLVHLERRHGPGPARRAVLNLISGDHVWFIEPTDFLPDGAVTAVLDHLAVSAPEILVVGHSIRDVYGAERPGRTPPDGQSPQLWDKIVRTSLLRDLGPALEGGAGWEIRVTWQLLEAAGRIEVSGGPGYVRRDLPTAVRARSEVGEPTEILDALDLALNSAADEVSRGVALSWFAADALRLLSAVPRQRRGTCFARVSRTWRGHAPELADLTDLTSARRKALETGSYRAWRLAGDAEAAARRARRLPRSFLRTARHPRTLKRALRAWPVRAWYRSQLRAPIEDDLVVYAAYWYTAYSCNPRAVYEKAREMAPWLRGVWVMKADALHLVPQGVDAVVSGTREYYRVMARAKYFVNNVNFPNNIVKRPGQVHLQTHHGTPLKSMGMDLVRSPYSRRRMRFPQLMMRVARWDFSISQNAFTSEQWERVYPSGTYESIETGYPRNDVLVNATEDDVARIRSELGIRRDQVAVLYLPTHREYQPGYVPQLDPGRLAESLGPGHVLLMRTHYFYRDDTVPATASDRVLDVADHPRIEDLYLAADVLVTDYSSAMFDYAVLDRPLVIYAPDWDDYRTLRGTTFDLMADPPGTVATTEAELTDVLVSRRAWDDESAARRQSFRDRFCSLEDGKASERVVRTLWPAPRGGHA